MRSLKYVIGLGLLCVGFSCGSAQRLDKAWSEPVHRGAWLQNLILQDNWTMLERDPLLTSGKFKKMAASPYAYFRGTAAVFWSDATLSAPRYLKTSFGTPESSFIATLSDPHPENIGSFRNADGQMLVDFNDFDGANFAPYYLDVRRLALGFLVLAAQAKLSNPFGLELAREMVTAYTQTIQALVAQQSQQQQGSKQKGWKPIRYKQGFGTIIDDLLKRAKRDGDIREALDEYTRVKDGKRIMFFGDVEDVEIPGVINDQVRAVTSEEKALVVAMVQQYQASRLDAVSPQFLAIKGISRRLGAGVSSYPRLRFYVLIEGPSASVDDDILLECKEIADPPLVADRLFFPKQPFADNGARVVWMQRQIQETAQNDIHLGWAVIAPMVFRIRERSKYQKNFSVSRAIDKLKSKKWSPSDLLTFANHAGGLLARSHALARTIQGDAGLLSISAALGQKQQDFIAETVTFAKAYAERTLSDYDLFRALLKEHGALLGYRHSRRALR